MVQINGIPALHDFHPTLSDFRADIISGLRHEQKSIEAKYFYDQHGLEIFDRICELPEYYPTRTEIGILQKQAHEIAGCIGAQAMIIEYGSGSSRKIRLLLDSLTEPRVYMPIDISKEYLFANARALAHDYPKLEIVAVCADYTQPLTLPAAHHQVSRRVVFFPGSTIGNLTHADAVILMKHTVNMLARGDGLLIGADLKKDIGILHDAYNDAQGVTAEFNLNLLARINRELAGNFDLAAFSHQAFYNEAAGRIEMHLVSAKAQTVTIGTEQFQFRAGETIHTENSYKYTIGEFQHLARAAGFTPRKVWVDEEDLFSVHYLEV